MIRSFLQLLAVLAISVNCCATTLAAEDIAPAEAMKRLTEGNQRFAAGSAANPRCDQARRSETAEQGQHPYATVLTCSDSRVSPEILFDQGIGDLFTVRVAGNVADTDEIGTIEYGVGHLHTPLLVVMGHSACGAVAAVVGGAELDGSLPQLVDNIERPVRETRRANPAARSNLLLARAVDANVFQSIQDILERSGEIRELAKEGKLKIVGAVYDIGGGGVRWLGAHPEQSSIIFSNKRSEPAAERPRPQKKPVATTRTMVAGTQAEKHGSSQPAGAATSGASSASRLESEGPATADQAFAALCEGNERFAAGAMQNPRRDKQRRLTTSRGQHPIATILACSDSRVPVERLFDQGIGDVFVVRFAGNVADTDQIASIEYSAGHLETPLLVVLGHTACGAVTAVASGAELHGSLPQLVDNIRPAVARARKANPGMTGNPLIAAAIRANVQQAVSDVLARSPSVRKRVDAGKLRIVGGVYDLASGKVEWMTDPTPAGGAVTEKPIEESSNTAPTGEATAPPVAPTPPAGPAPAPAEPEKPGEPKKDGPDRR
jgi:carbonic anhydrase